MDFIVFPFSINLNSAQLNHSYFQRNMKKRTPGYFVISLVILGVVTLFSFNACSGLKRSGSRLYESFYVGEKGTQYFIKPITFSNQDSENLRMDYTFRFTNTINASDTATINFTLRSNQLIREMDSLCIQTETNQLTIRNTKRLFMERENNQFISRFSSTSPSQFLPGLFQNTNWTITVYSENYSTSVSSDRSAKRKIERLNHNLFTLVK